MSIKTALATTSTSNVMMYFYFINNAINLKKNLFELKAAYKI